MNHPAYYNMVGFAYYTCPPLMMALYPVIACSVLAAALSSEILPQAKN